MGTRLLPCLGSVRDGRGTSADERRVASMRPARAISGGTRTEHERTSYEATANSPDSPGHQFRQSHTGPDHHDAASRVAYGRSRSHSVFQWR